MKGRLVTVWVIGVWRDEVDDVTTQIQETMIDENTIHQLHAIWRSCDYWRRTCMNRHRWLSVLWRRRLTDRQIYRCATVAINSTKHRKHNDGPRPLAPHQFQKLPTYSRIVGADGQTYTGDIFHRALSYLQCIHNCRTSQRSHTLLPIRPKYNLKITAAHFCRSEAKRHYSPLNTSPVAAACDRRLRPND